MSEPSIAPLGGGNQSFINSDPIASEPAKAESLMCIDKASEGAEGASGSGTDALVRRFSDASGAGGGSGYVDLPAPKNDSCADDALSAIAACGTAAYQAARTAGFGVLFSGSNCVANVGSFLECLGSDAVSKR